MYPLGLIVYSKSGRDKRRPFIVVSTGVERDGEYVYLADGDLRKLDKPKKKKILHVQITKHIAEDIGVKLKNNERMPDAEIRKALLQYVDKKGVT